MKKIWMEVFGGVDGLVPGYLTPTSVDHSNTFVSRREWFKMHKDTRVYTGSGRIPTSSCCSTCIAQSCLWLQSQGRFKPWGNRVGG